MRTTMATLEPLLETKLHKEEIVVADDSAKNTVVVFSKPKTEQAVIKYPLQYILYTCYVYSDGIGDAVFFSSISSLHTKTQKLLDYNSCYIIMVPEQFSGQIKKTLLAATLGVSEDNVHLILIPYHAQKGLLYRNVFRDYLKGNDKLKHQLSRTVGMVNISTSEMDANVTKYERREMTSLERMTGLAPKIGFQLRSFFEKLEIDVHCFSIGELGTTSFASDTLKEYPGYYYHLGIGAENAGLLLEPKKTLKEPSGFFEKFENRDFAKILLDKSDDYETFKKNSLLVPVYFQLGFEYFISFLNVLANSPLTKGHQEILIVANKEEDNILKYLNSIPEGLSENVSQLTVTYQDDISKKLVSEILKNTKCTSEEGQIKVRIIIGYWLSNEDRSHLLSSAQYFCGSSGDNTFMEACSQSLIPLTQIKNHKTDFFKNFIEEVNFILKKSEKNYLSPYFSQQYELGEAHNTLVHRKKWYPNLVPSAKQSIKSAEKRLGAMLTPELQEQWTLLTDILRKDCNFYNKFSSTIIEPLLKSIERRSYNRYW